MDLIVDTAFVKQVFARPGDRRALKGAFIFTDPAVTTDMSFEADGFIRRLVGFLVKKAGHKAAADFSKHLVRSVAECNPSALSMEHGTVMQVLTNMAGDSRVPLPQTAKAGDSLTAEKAKHPAAEPEPSATEHDKVMQAPANMNGGRKVQRLETAKTSHASRPEKPRHPTAKREAPSAENGAARQVPPFMPGGSKAQRSETVHTSHALRSDKSMAAATEALVANAGVVIAAPYLPRLWNMLGLTQGTEFKNAQAAERAVHLIQFLADAGTETPEHELVLNKILCGIEISAPVCKGIDITNVEIETIEGLIKGMIENWKTIGNTSVAGFRESFLQRRGRLVLKKNGWRLKVEQRAFDMLLDRIPWSFAFIKQAWMGQALHVTWR